MYDYSDTQELQDDLYKWSVETFGNPNSPIGSLHHLKEEIDELLNEIENISSKENITLTDLYNYKMEWADLWTLVLDAAKRAGINVSDLNMYGIEKLNINKKRIWGEPDENGVVRHIKKA